jgi:hypothetical protein
MYCFWILLEDSGKPFTLLTKRTHSYDDTHTGCTKYKYNYMNCNNLFQKPTVVKMI